MQTKDSHQSKVDHIVGIHLDLKYLMPRKTYLTQWVRDIADMGINTLLLEYEDKFPYAKYPFLQQAGAFTPDELRAFLTATRHAGLRVIPLVQTLSHLEFALAHEELAHLRELPHIPTQINPGNPEAVQFVHDLITEVLAFHEEDELFHLGADETWHLGRNPDNAGELQQLGEVGYWTRHTRQFIDRIIAAGKRPLVWDDVLWKAPESIKHTDLPKQTVLVSWQYSVSTSSVQGMAATAKRVRIYREAGYDVLGAPCLNWGVLTPRYEHCLNNTQAWADIITREDVRGRGLLNTAWMCFHTLQPTQALPIAATARAMTGHSAAVDRQWQSEFLQDYFDTPQDNLPAALTDLGRNWEQPIEGLSRPITPIVYGCMDMVLFYASADERRACGQYPLDWRGINFNDLYRQKITLLREQVDPQIIRVKLEELNTVYHRAQTGLSPLSQQAKRHQDEAKLLALFADMKVLHVALLRYLVLGEGARQPLVEALAEQEDRLKTCCEPFVEPPSLDRLKQLWWAPAATAMNMSTTPLGNHKAD